MGILDDRPWAWADQEIVRSRRAEGLQAQATALRQSRPPPRQTWAKRAASWADQMAQYERAKIPEGAPPSEPGRRKGLFSGLKDIVEPIGDVGRAVGLLATGDFGDAGAALRDAGGDTLRALNVPRQTLIEPIVGEAIRHPLRSLALAPFGGPSLPAMAGVFGSAAGDVGISNPLDREYQKNQAAYERFRGRLPAGAQTALDVGLDPLTYVGPGAVKGALKAAPLAIRGSRAAKFTAAMLEQPLKTAAAAGVGAAAGSQIAESTGAPDWAQVAAPLAGGLAGGLLGPSAARGAARAARGAPENIRAGVREARLNPERGSLNLGRGELPEEGAVQRIPHDQIVERPDLFQARKSDPGKSYGEARVRDIIENYDPMRMTTGKVVQDTNTGDMVLLSGHHRLEVNKRMAASGRLPNEGDWQVFRADLSDPEQVKRLQALADYENYGVADTTVGENLNVYRRARARGEEHGSIVRSMRSLTKQDAEDLRVLAELPDDIAQEISQQPVLAGIGAEIGRGKLAYQFTDADVRGLWRRYKEGGRTRTEVARVIELTGRKLAEARAADAQQGFGMLLGDGGAEWDATRARVLEQADRIAALEGQILESRRQAVAARNALRRVGKANPERDARYAAIVQELDDDVRAAEAALERVRAGDDTPIEQGGSQAEVSPDDDRAAAAGEGAPGPERAQWGGEHIVQQGTLEGGPVTTGLTEAEMQGIRPEQGALTVFHGTGSPLSGPLREGSFVTTDRNAAEVFARADARLNGGEPRVYAFEATPDALAAPAENDFAAAYGGAQIVRDPQGLRPVASQAELLRTRTAAAHGEPIAELPQAVRPAEPAKAEMHAEPGTGMAEEATLRQSEGLSGPMTEFPAEPRGAGFERQQPFEKPGVAGHVPVAPAAAVGAPPTQGALLPPGTAPPGGLPPAGGRGTQPFGTTPPTDLLHAPTSAQLAQWQPSAITKLGDRVKKAFGAFSQEDADARLKVTPAVRAFKQIEHVISHNVEEMWSVAEAAMNRGAGLRIDSDHQLVRIASGQKLGIAEDILEQTTPAGKAAWAALTPQEQAGLQPFIRFNDLLNETRTFHGAANRFDDTIEGSYFPRKVASQTYTNAAGQTVTVEAGRGPAPSRRVGANRTKSRVFESVEELQRKGYNLDDPGVAWRAMARGKLLDAADAYVAGQLGPLAVPHPGSTLSLAAVDQPAFAGKWFTPAVARRIQAGLDRPQPGPLARVANAANAILTPLRASGDVSGTFQQGLRIWLTDPKAAGKIWWAVARSLKNPEHWQDLLLDMDNRAMSIRNAAGEQMLPNGILDLTRTNLRFSGGFTEGELRFPEQLANRMGKAGIVGKGAAGVFNASNAHFDRFLNASRVWMALNQAERLAESGLKGADFLDALSVSNRALNRAFGWTDTELSPIEKAVPFAPRYTRATIETVAAMLSKGATGDMARKHMALLLGEGAILTFVLNELRGYETEWDPRDANFMRIRNVAGLDISPYGSYNVLFRAIAQGIGGESGAMPIPDPAAFKRFAEAKLNPVLGALYWPTQGHTYLGEPLDFSTLGGAASALGKMAGQNLPFGVQALAEQGPAAAAVSSLGVSANPVTPTERRDFARSGHRGYLGIDAGIPGAAAEPGAAREKFGKGYGELSGAQKAEVNRTPAVAAAQKAADRNALTRENQRSAVLAVTEGIGAKVDALSSELEARQITGNEFRDQYRLLQAEMRGARATLRKQPGGQDADVRGWFALYDKAALPDGRLDWPTLDTLQAEYRLSHQGIDAKVDKLIGTRDNPTVAAYRVAQKDAAEYYRLPAYRGMTLEQSRKATTALMSAQDMVSFGQARNVSHAFRLIAQKDPEAAALGRRASRAPANPARKAFRRSHAATLGRFYSDI